MAERGPLAEVDLNLVAPGEELGKVMSQRDSLMAQKASLGKVADPEESLLSGKDSMTDERSVLCSGLGHAEPRLFLPETAKLKQEESDAFKNIDIIEDGDESCSDGDSTDSDEHFSEESWDGKAEKPGIVRNLLDQKMVGYSNSYPRSTLKVLKALRLEPGFGDPLVEANLLPGSSKGVMADSVAAFLFFIRIRYSMFEARQWGEDQERSSHSQVFRVLHFTNIHREADTGTRYLRRRLLGRSKEGIVLGVIVYRTINRIETFEDFKENFGLDSSLPSSTNLKDFVKFIKKKKEKVFTNAHQALSVDKVTDVFNHVLENLEELTHRLLEASSLEEAFYMIKDINYLGGFYAYQIVCDLVEIGLLKFSEDSWTFLGPGANNGLKEVRADGDSDVGDQELVRRLARIADYGLPHLGQQAVRFLNRRLSVKAVEHSLCEYFKFTRAVKNGIERGRKYKPRKVPEESCGICRNQKEARDWKECILCAQSFHTDCLKDWRNTTMDFFLCEPCYVIEVVKGCDSNGVDLEEQQINIKRSFIRLEK